MMGLLIYNVTSTKDQSICTILIMKMLLPTISALSVHFDLLFPRLILSCCTSKKIMPVDLQFGKIHLILYFSLNEQKLHVEKQMNIEKWSLF